ncbi:MOSC domain-containing protein [Roseivirga sp.]|uniref:MOSC domain-containing protein n=1 Tax=Roseivirga sp. TaxID=1964215 RepID=UPI003B518BA6
MLSINEMKSRLAKPGRIVAITVRPARRMTPIEIPSVNAIAKRGLEGDHYSSNGGKRQVTLIMSEHLAAAASILGLEQLDPPLVRRNIITQGINLLSLKDKRFRIGEVLLEYTGECHPCSRMEENLGEGGYNAMRGHGGITARILESGMIHQGDEITLA